MPIKITVWDEAQTKREVMKRFQNAQTQRSPIEQRWQSNEQSVYSTGTITGANYMSGSLNSLLTNPFPGVDQSGADTDNVYIFKNPLAISIVGCTKSAGPGA